MDYTYTISGLIPNPCHTMGHFTDASLQSITHTLITYVKGPYAPRLPNLSITATPRDRLGFSLGSHADKIESTSTATVRAVDLRQRALRLIEISKLNADYPISVLLPVGKGVQTKEGTSLFTWSQLDIAVCCVIENLRVVQLQTIRRSVDEATPKSVIEPYQLTLVGKKTRIDSVMKRYRSEKGSEWKFDGHPLVTEKKEAMMIAKDLVEEWEEEEKARVCTLLSFGAWSHFYFKQNEQYAEDVTCEQLVDILRRR